ncbi:hypothetical protein AB0N87_18305, partial [Streptomyces sp. NPDC093228]|uniref:hypothetical protein n=1 Tax=Streptomyces sp. NPDC093228 TaxID=3155070 RepID=UPI003449197C
MSAVSTSKKARLPKTPDKSRGKTVSLYSPVCARIGTLELVSRGEFRELLVAGQGCCESEKGQEVAALS